MEISPIILNKKANYTTVSNKAATNPAANYNGNFELSGGNFEGYKNYLPNLNKTTSFTGACSNLRRLYASSPEGNGYVVKKGPGGAYLVDGETGTKIYYGKDAEKFLNKTTVFNEDTQIICPNDGELLVETGGKKIPLSSNGAVILSNGREAKINVVKGNPLVITSERPPLWYEEYGSTSVTKGHKEQFEQLSHLNYHLYSGHLQLSDLGEEIVDKLIDANLAELTGENHIALKNYYAPDYEETIVAKFLDDKEVAVFNHFYKPAWKIRTTTKEARKASAEGLKPELKQKMLDKQIIYDISKNNENGNQIYWRELFENEYELKILLQNYGFSKNEQDEITEFWKKTNKLGFDFTGHKFLSDGIAVYELKDKLNNWNLGKTEWDTHSNAIQTTREGSFAPYIGVSEVRSKKDYAHAVPFKKIRNAEVLHSHPDKIDKRQTEIYMITEGAAAITIIENDKPKIVTLKAGEGLVIQPGVKHCVSAVKGNYEHLVCQIPSTFQYGFGFKKTQQYPEGFSEEAVNKLAVKKLDEVRI